MWPDYWGFGIFPLLWPIVWFVIVIAIFSHLFRSDRRRHMDNMSPEDILSQRFAKGEIDEAEYKKRLEIIKQHAK